MGRMLVTLANRSPEVLGERAVVLFWIWTGCQLLFCVCGRSLLSGAWHIRNSAPLGATPDVASLRVRDAAHEVEKSLSRLTPDVKPGRSDHHILSGDPVVVFCDGKTPTPALSGACRDAKSTIGWSSPHHGLSSQGRSPHVAGGLALHQHSMHSPVQSPGYSPHACTEGSHYRVRPWA
jgi:hypothetical protein